MVRDPQTQNTRLGWVAVLQCTFNTENAWTVLKCVFFTHLSFAFHEKFRLIYLVVFFGRACLVNAWQLTVGQPPQFASVIYSLTQWQLLQKSTGICIYRCIYLYVVLLLFKLCIIWHIHFGRIVNVLWFKPWQ